MSVRVNGPVYVVRCFSWFLLSFCDTRATRIAPAPTPIASIISPFCPLFLPTPLSDISVDFPENRPCSFRRGPQEAMRWLTRLDVFPKFDAKFEQDARHRTAVGGVFSLLSLFIIATLVVGEVRYFFSTVEQHEMYVDHNLGGMMDITVNITFPRVPCDLITADVVDSFGNFAKDVEHDTVKTRVDRLTLEKISEARPLVDENKKLTKALDPDGAEKENCPSCYGAEPEPGACCHTCDDVRRAYAQRKWVFNEDDISVAQCAEERLRKASLAKSQEGCNLFAKYKVTRVTGNIHFVPGRMFSVLGQHLHDLGGKLARELNLSHIVHSLEFGEQFPGQMNPMEGLVNTRGAVDATEEVNGRFSYFVKVVPTQYEVASFLGVGKVVESNQYSVTHHFTAIPKGEAADRQPALVPGVFITYDLSPIRVFVLEKHPYPSFVHLLLQLCAVGGGVFTVAGIVDALIFHGVRRVQRKMQEGKQF
ncbi:ERGIC and golgi family 3 [Trypanosoma rangeli]|uniref:ERGIC and golgi family 3 n=1 Tax=Trypanosoma rangeli TaxID=5698 RepID=A0A3R7KGP9_TRYRA|nr:ERGIC and golgi family 3 [Trypanosoma rangeli]RNF07332.1 ERGIC and golgi family 3 [Trypanosoma rangeli]|eukprot:RNF07332.1 ERGIC and golgi family 3 [Trypanosoma rangeli]